MPEWLAQEQPDVLCIQETKLQPDQFPSETFETLGYKSYLFSAQKKGYSGWPFLRNRNRIISSMEWGSRSMIMRDVSSVRFRGCIDRKCLSSFRASGDERQDFKMIWLEDFQKYVVELQKSRPNLILCGDYNICHEPIDIHDPIRNAKNSGFLPEEREWMTRFLSAGFTDTFRFLNPDKQEYTWWSYRFNSRSKNKGWRIDYCMVSDNMKPKVKAAYILNDAVHSDHCPAVLEIE